MTIEEEYGMTNEEAIDELKRIRHHGTERLINALEVAISALESQRWISVKEKLPEVGEMCLVFSVYDQYSYECGVKLGFYNGRYFEFVEITGYLEFKFQEKKGMIFPHQYPKADLICPGNEYITHWMPLPQPTKG